ncbi:MAG: NADH:ubiquinone reductase (Na(+)-transporting) subunit C [Fidelibacterota bacterium]
MGENRYYSFIFIAIITIVAAGVLSFAAQFLRPIQELNEAVEKKKNIMQAVGLVESTEKLSREAIINKFDQSIKPLAVNYRGEIMTLPEGQSVADIDPEAEARKPLEKQLLPVYLQQQDGETAAYCIPVFGKGLWSTIYGYLALKQDLNTIKGITFYKHGETPGLGAEVSTQWFTENFEGKQIFDRDSNLVSVEIIKGRVTESTPQAYRKVDGISGATKTCDGVNDFLLKDLEKYKNYIMKNRTNKE